MSKKETKLLKFERIYREQIQSGAWISKDDMAKNGFFPITNSNGRDIRFIKRKYELDIVKEGTREVMFRITGIKGNSLLSRSIRKDIIDQLKNKKCAMTASHTNIEIDHKNGRYNDERVLNRKTQTIDDFQPLNKMINNLKREHCKKCKITNIRFDARELNFLIPTLDGQLEHNNLPNGCEGCYFYDITYFNKKHNEIISMNNGKQEFNDQDFYNYYTKCKKSKENAS
ncbi:hypothetical protein MZM54_03510 [[Brevibacterium] frigoritolerans]|nr:hypothetical protein [Peribacillus frigoritolerans]